MAQQTGEVFLKRDHLGQLLDSLCAQGYRCIGPRLHDGAIVYGELQSPEQLPVGVHVRQSPGSYQVEQGESPRCFAWSNGPQLLKPLVFRSREVQWKVVRDTDGGLDFSEVNIEAEPTAVIGVRGCDLAALALQDRHFLNNACVDEHYRARRESLLLVAVNCTHPAATCFCAATGDGPAVYAGYDLLLDELAEGYVLCAGSDKGNRILQTLETQAVSSEQKQAVVQQNSRASASQTRSLPSSNLEQALFNNLDHPRWQTVAERCLSCGNCTAVCPTCFCSSEQDSGTLDLSRSEHIREWDSCFTQGHSYIHGITVRADTRLRYRQWLTHKLGSWHSQYGRSGCVGCGRCISWCPVGIDITEEVAAIVGGEA